MKPTIDWEEVHKAIECMLKEKEITSAEISKDECAASDF